MRAVMLSFGSISPNLTQLLKEAVKKGAVESEQSSRAATIAANVLRPAAADIRGDHSVRWGLTRRERRSGGVQRPRRADPSIERGGREHLLHRSRRFDYSDRAGIAKGESG